jgi:hypothetical protein
MIDTLVDDLEVLRSSAGRPSLSVIEKRSEQLRVAGTPVFGVRVTRLPRSTVHDLFRREHPLPPRPELVESLWAVLCRIAVDGGRTPVLPRSLSTLDGLRRRLESINLPERARAAPAPNPTGTGPRGDAPDGADQHGADQHGADQHGADQHGADQAGAAPGVLDPFGAPPPGGDEDANRRWLLDSAIGARTRTWWYGGRGLVPEWLEAYFTLEPLADGVRAYAPLSIPGLLQTEEYAWAALRRDRPGASAAELACLVHLRMRRQEPLWRRDALRFWAVIDENVLRDEVCGPTAMRAQLDHLVQVARTPHITVQVMPREAHGHNATGGPVTLLRFPERGFPDVVFVEQHDYGLYPAGSGDVSHYRKVLTRLAIEALQPEESVEFLCALRADWPK